MGTQQKKFDIEKRVDLEEESDLSKDRLVCLCESLIEEIQTVFLP
jgi:hypothetical protein